MNPSRQIRAEIVDRVAGNPFFAEELVRALVDQGVLVGVRGNYKRITSVAVGVLPSTVRGVISFRIDRLEKEEKLFIEGASVIGREFPVSATADVVGLDASTAQIHVEKLLELEMFYEHASRGVLAFKHPLVQEVAYASLVIDRRRSLHRRAAKALSTHFARFSERACRAHSLSLGRRGRACASCRELHGICELDWHAGPSTSESDLGTRSQNSYDDARGAAC